MASKHEEVPKMEDSKANDFYTRGVIHKLSVDKMTPRDEEIGTNERTNRGFKPRHAQMIAIGGAIGTSLFLGTAQVLCYGGPGFLLITYGILCIMVYGIMTGIAEVATYLPIPGGTMSYYGNKYVSKSMGFALGWLY